MNAKFYIVKYNYFKIISANKFAVTGANEFANTVNTNDLTAQYFSFQQFSSNDQISNP
jgi:hypothetical protein